MGSSPGGSKSMTSAQAAKDPRVQATAVGARGGGANSGWAEYQAQLANLRAPTTTGTGTAPGMGMVGGEGGLMQTPTAAFFGASGPNGYDVNSDPYGPGLPAPLIMPAPPQPRATLAQLIASQQSNQGNGGYGAGSRAAGSGYGGSARGGPGGFGGSSARGGKAY